MASIPGKALVTGASGGIGFELARLLAADGYDLQLVDIRKEVLESAAHDLSVLFPERSVQLFPRDLSDVNAAASVFEQVGSAPDILINNAGFGTYGAFSETDWERESRMILLHVHTLTHLTKLFLPSMIQRGNGRIMNVASVAGFQPSPFMAVYNASKAYVLSFSEAIAEELRGSGVTVTVLCPGLTRTGFQAGVGNGNPELVNNPWIAASADVVAKYGYQAMMQGQMTAIPGAINYLLAHANRFLPRRTVVQLVRRAQERNRRKLHQGQKA